MRRFFYHIVGVCASRAGLAAGLAVFGLWAGVAGLKVYHWPRQPVFFSDPAFRFRYVAMYAAGEPIPALDRAAQWPEGVRPAQADFLTQDAFVGLSYRLLRPLLPPGLTLARFLAWHVALWSALAVVAVYAWGRALAGSRAGGVLAALTYACSLVIYVRGCGAYLREDFVLPAYFLALYALARVVAGGGWRWWSAAAAATFVTLVSWHASSFLLFFTAAALATLVVTSRAPGAVARAAAALAAATVAAYAVHPALRAKVLLASPAAALIAAVVVAGAVGAWRRWPWWARLAALGVVFAALYAVGRPFGAAGEYSHIYTMVWYKIRYLGAKPADPGALPLAAREIWSGPANSPSAAGAAVLFALPAAMAVVPLARGWRGFVRGFREPAGVWGALTLVLVVLFGGLYFIYTRFGVLLIFPVAALTALYCRPGASARARWWLVIPAVLLPLEAAKALRYEDRPWPWTRLLTAAAAADAGYATNVGDEWARLVRWLASQPDRRETAVLAPIADAAAFLTYAETPVVVHPIYEAPGMRAKVHECWGAAFRDEETLYRVCRKYDATYVAYPADLIMNAGPESLRYAEGVTKVPTTSCAWRMQFAPATLRHFAPVFQTTSWRLFLVGVAGDAAPALGPPSPLFTAPAGPPGAYYDDAYSPRAKETVAGVVAAYNAGVERYRAGDLVGARAFFRRALALYPGFAAGWEALMWLEADRRDGPAAAYAAATTLALDPYDPGARALIAELGRSR